MEKQVPHFLLKAIKEQSLRPEVGKMRLIRLSAPYLKPTVANKKLKETSLIILEGPSRMRLTPMNKQIIISSTGAR